MPDLFDNFFDRVGNAFGAKNTGQRNLFSSQVNTGRFYNFPQNGTNNNYWLPRADLTKIKQKMERRESASSMESDSSDF